MFQVVSVVLVVVNNAAANTGLYVSFPPDVCPGMGWLDHLVDDLVALFLVSYGTSILVFIVAVVCLNVCQCCEFKKYIYYVLSMPQAPIEALVLGGH